jgi:hypothetical protein
MTRFTPPVELPVRPASVAVASLSAGVTLRAHVSA